MARLCRVVATLAAASAQLVVPNKRMIHRHVDPLTQRNITHSEQKQALFEYREFPVYMGIATRDDPADDVLANMRWWISPETGACFLDPLAPPKYVYMTQHNAVVGGIWQEHHDSFAALVARLKPQHVMEIGGGHGYLAMKLLFTGAVKHWTMVDPNPIDVFAMPNLDIVKGRRRRESVCCS